MVSREMETEEHMSIQTPLSLFPGCNEQSGALFSPDRIYRYRLWRTWDSGRGIVCWVMLNPSTADEFQLDPTCRRVDGFTRAWGFGGWTVVNLFALRSTDPKALYRHEDPVGPDNDRVIIREITSAPLVIAAWGGHGMLLGRGDRVRTLYRFHQLKRERNLMGLGLTKGGQPIHPLYQRRDAGLIVL